MRPYWSLFLLPTLRVSPCGWFSINVQFRTRTLHGGLDDNNLYACFARCGVSEPVEIVTCKSSREMLSDTPATLLNNSSARADDAMSIVPFSLLPTKK